MRMKIRRRKITGSEERGIFCPEKQYSRSQVPYENTYLVVTMSATQPLYGLKIHCKDVTLLYDILLILWHIIKSAFDA